MFDSMNLIQMSSGDVGIEFVIRLATLLFSPLRLIDSL